MAETLLEADSRVFKLTVQQDANDCVIACLESFLGVPYAQVRAAAPRGFNSNSPGISTRQLLNMAKRLGRPLRLQKDFSSQDIGIIDLWRKKGSKHGKGGHVAVYLRGMVWTTANGTLWADLRTYAANHDWDVEGLITHVDAPVTHIDADGFVTS